MPAIEMAAHVPAQLPCSKRKIYQKVDEETTTKKDALPSDSRTGLVSDGHKSSALLLAE